MRWLVAFVTSSIGAKVLMALTGLVLVGFVVGHMVGNLQVFAGQDTLNDYAEFLQSKPVALWSVRFFLLICFVVHVFLSGQLTLDNRAARPVAYAQKTPLKSTFTSRNMFVTGALVFSFLVYHVLHFTTHTTNHEYAQLVQDMGTYSRPDVYAMVVTGFRDPLIAGVYMVAMVLLGLHLSHAISSMFQSLGLNSPKWFGLTDKVGPLVATLVVIGNLSMPIAVLAGLVPLPPGVM